MRECLSADRTIPVEGSLSEAWLRARDTLDLCGHTLTLQLPAEYIGATSINGQIPGGAVVIQGGRVSGTGQLFRVNDGARFTLSGVTLCAPGGMGVVVASGTVLINDVTFDGIDICVDVCGPDSIAGVGNATFLPKSFGAALTAEDGGWIGISGFAMVHGARFSRCFAQADLGGKIDGTGFTWAGAATGRRYQAYTGGLVFTAAL